MAFDASTLSTLRFTIPGEPMGKPRMTQRDKWMKRECVVRYYAWKNLAIVAFRSACGTMPDITPRVDWVAWVSMPASWSEKKKAKHAGQLHMSRPDRDNIDKALLDALWSNDACVACGYIEKRWDDGKGARLDVIVYASN